MTGGLGPNLPSMYGSPSCPDVVHVKACGLDGDLEPTGRDFASGCSSDSSNTSHNGVISTADLGASVDDRRSLQAPPYSRLAQVGVFATAPHNQRSALLARYGM